MTGSASWAIVCRTHSRRSDWLRNKALALLFRDSELPHAQNTIFGFGCQNDNINSVDRASCPFRT